MNYDRSYCCQGCAKVFLPKKGDNMFLLSHIDAVGYLSNKGHHKPYNIKPLCVDCASKAKDNLPVEKAMATALTEQDKGTQAYRHPMKPQTLHIGEMILEQQKPKKDPCARCTASATQDFKCLLCPTRNRLCAGCYSRHEKACYICLDNLPLCDKNQSRDVCNACRTPFRNLNGVTVKRLCTSYKHVFYTCSGCLMPVTCQRPRQELKMKLAVPTDLIWKIQASITKQGGQYVITYDNLDADGDPLLGVDGRHNELDAAMEEVKDILKWDFIELLNDLGLGKPLVE